jgi:polysaccharide pyruvyl transferase WcaK-like protein
MKASVNIGLLSADLNTGNMGCNALTYSALLLLEQVCSSLNIQASYKLFTNYRSSEAVQYYTKLSHLNIDLVSNSVGFKRKMKDAALGRSGNTSKFESAFNSCDILFEIAGGDSFSDIYGIQRMKNVLRNHRRADKKGIPVVFLPQTIGPFSSSESKKIAKECLSRAKHVFARDPLSYVVAKEYVLSESLSASIDMAFFMDYKKTANQEDKIRVGINPSGLLWNRGYDGKNQFGLKEDYREVLSLLINDLQKRDNVKVVLVPHVLSGPGYSVEDDYKVCRWLLEKYPECQIAPFFYTPVEAKSFISGLDLLIGSRMHCCIAAYSSGVPIYPLAYSRKFKGLFKEELDYPYGAELVSDEAVSIVEGLDQLFDNFNHVRSEMPQRLEVVGGYRNDLVEALSKVFP